MNEDESTQTLSDKVIDRANILRFGKPANLQAVGSNGKAVRPATFLPYEVWNQWIDHGKSLAPAVATVLEQWITRCNNALEEIGKPFGYRSANCIRAYVRQYPLKSSEEVRVRHAMADQIEQRVLPKLRGIDPKEPGAFSAITTIGNLVDQELKDPLLTEAIHKGAEGHSFIWTGVDRQQ